MRWLNLDIDGAGWSAQRRRAGGRSEHAAGENGTFTLSVSSKLVIEAVNVKDKQGKSISGLTAKDFTVTENGVNSTSASASIRNCRRPLANRKARPGEHQGLQQARRHADRCGEARRCSYKDKRLIAIYFDLTSMPPEDKVRALEAAEKFIRTQMTSADLVSIMRYGGGSVDVLQDFTDDHNRLLSILETLIVGENQQSEDISDDASAADTGAAFGQDGGEFNLFNTDRQLSALQTAAKMLGRLSEKKVLIYFASGLTLHGVDNQAQLHATDGRGDSVRCVVLADRCARLRSAGSPGRCDAGLAGQCRNVLRHGSDGGDHPAAAVAGHVVRARGRHGRQSATGLQRPDAGHRAGAAEYDQLLHHWLLHDETTLDGRFRRIKISVNPEMAANLDYRQGYYAGKQFGAFTAADKERQLEDALMLGDPVTELTIAMEINYFQLNRAEYFVPIVVKIPGRELALAKKGGAQHTLIDFLIEVKDAVRRQRNGAESARQRKHQAQRCDSGRVGEAARRVRHGLYAFPGKIQHQVSGPGRRDREDRNVPDHFTIPNLNKEANGSPSARWC